MKRNVAFHVIAFVIAIAGCELAAWALVALSLQLGIFHFYPRDFFTRITDAQLAQASSAHPLGWISDEKPRAIAKLGGAICGYAFGDSFTYGAEVADEEAWLYILSRRLGCTVANYGNNGYGIDQAVLRHARVAPEGGVTLLGLYIEMVRRDVAASITFYVGTEPAAYQGIKPYFTLEGDGIALHPIPQPATRAAIAAHHAGDYYMNHVWTVAKFPYLLQLALAGYRRVMKDRTEMLWDTKHPSGSGVLARRLVERLAQAAKEHNSRMVVVMMAPVDRMVSELPLYDAFANDLRRHGDICVIDTKPTLREQVVQTGLESISAPGRHYGALGNRLVADAVFDGLRRCSISPPRAD